MSETEEWVTVAIGRNRHNDPADVLTAAQWGRFRDAVDARFTRRDFYVLGQSTSTEHGLEETYIVGGLLRSGARIELAHLAWLYDQTAIALTVGGERITARRPDGWPE